MNKTFKTRLKENLPWKWEMPKELPRHFKNWDEFKGTMNGRNDAIEEMERTIDGL